MITLTSDFGLGSPYVAAMKAVLLATCPEATLVDLNHGIASYDLAAASFLLWAGTRHFAAGAVHLAVVDPGVGTERRPLALSVGNAYYVGPDNGIFTMVMSEAETAGAAIRGVELARAGPVSATFEGRDVFAPAAAALAGGAAIARLGRPIEESPVRLPERPGQVVWVDGFGNLVTNLRPPVHALRVNGHPVRVAARTFGEAPRGQVFFYTGSMGFLEVAVREGRADALLGAGSGAPVEEIFGP